jgi:hypothetical protein
LCIAHRFARGAAFAGLPDKTAHGHNHAGSGKPIRRPIQRDTRNDA